MLDLYQSQLLEELFSRGCLRGHRGHSLCNLSPGRGGDSWEIRGRERGRLDMKPTNDAGKAEQFLMPMQERWGAALCIGEWLDADHGHVVSMWHVGRTGGA